MHSNYNKEDNYNTTLIKPLVSLPCINHCTILHVRLLSFSFLTEVAYSPLRTYKIRVKYQGPSTKFHQSGLCFMYSLQQKSKS